MPEKTKQVRARRARAQGTTMTVKASDTGETGGRSAHALKKSHGSIGRAPVKGRSVSPRRPPGEGKTTQSLKLPTLGTGSSGSRRSTLPAEAAATYRKGGRRKTTLVAPSEPAAAYRREERPKQPRNEAAERHKVRSQRGSPVQGRKKEPSQMGRTHAGGPHKRSRLHGG